MKGKWRRAIISFVCLIVMSVSITYAWVLNSGTTVEGKFVFLDYTGGTKGNLLVASSEMAVEFYYVDSSGNYVLKPSTDTTPLNLTGMVPNDMMPFRLRFYNYTGASQIVSLIVSGVMTEDVGLLNQLFVGGNAGEGYINATDANVERPSSFILCLSDATERRNKAPDQDGNLTISVFDLRIYDSLIIPPTAAGSYVELDCYFWLNDETSIDHAGKTLTISNFRVLV